jgi:hypothetical protein
MKVTAGRAHRRAAATGRQQAAYLSASAESNNFEREINHVARICLVTPLAQMPRMPQAHVS